MGLVILYQLHLTYYIRYNPSNKIIIKFILVIVKIDLIQNSKIFHKNSYIMPLVTIK